MIVRTLLPKRYMMEFAEFIRDKRIIFVGPGSIMRGRGLGKEIDSYDIVVRTNHLPVIMENNPEIKADIGSRTDLLYINGQYFRLTKPLPLRIYRSIGLKWICMKICHHTDYAELKKFCQVRIFIKSAIELQKKIRCPLTGPVIAYDLLKFNPKSIHFTGIDFYQNSGIKSIRGDNPKTYQSYIDERYIPDKIKEENIRKGIGEGAGHDIVENAKYLKQLCDDGKITMPDFVVHRMNEVLN